jgi:spore germination cell wall hydrolase CwlJ-like protein
MNLRQQGRHAGLCGALGVVLSCVNGVTATYEQRVIAAVIAGEAANQGRAGMVAVAEVIHQRVLESGWTPFRVVTHGNRRGIYAFSCLNKTTPPALVRKWHLEPAYAIALELAQLVMEDPDRLPDTTRSANFFTRRGENPEWARGRKPVVVIKNHEFYRIPANAGATRAW